MSKKIVRESCLLQSNGVVIHCDIYLDLGLKSSVDSSDTSAKYSAFKGLVQIAHGMIEHTGKYKQIAEFLTKNGFIVAINDHRGHGDSVNYNPSLQVSETSKAIHKTTIDCHENPCGFSRNDEMLYVDCHEFDKSNSRNDDSSVDDCLTSFANPADAHKSATFGKVANSRNDNIDSNNKIYLGEMGKNGFESAMQDMYNLHLSLKTRFKPKKFILMGHSMGSLLSRRFLQEYEDCLDMLVLCGTPKPEPFIGVGIAFLKILYFFGLKNVARDFANKFSLLSFNAKYAKIDNLANGKNSGTFWINRDTEELKRKLADNKQNFSFSINSFICLFMGLKRVFSPYPRKIANPSYKSQLPILFISGEDDACGGFGVGAIKAFKHIIAQGYGNARLILYANARHELFLELNKDEVFSDILAFIEKNL